MTEFEEKREALAKSLFELVHGEGTWETVATEGDYRFNYKLDAEEVLVMQPHLLSASERVRLWRYGREWIEAIVNRYGSQLTTSSLTQWELFYEDMKEAVDE